MDQVNDTKIANMKIADLMKEDFEKQGINPEKGLCELKIGDVVRKILNLVYLPIDSNQLLIFEWWRSLSWDEREKVYKKCGGDEITIDLS